MIQSFLLVTTHLQDLKQHAPAKEFENVVFVSLADGATDPIIQTASIFEGTDWIKKLGKKYIFGVGEKGLLVVADSSAISSPKDQLLRELLTLGTIDGSGTIIVAKNSPKLANLISQVSPFNDSRSLLQNGTYRLRIIPTMTIAYGAEKGDEANATFSPKDPKTLRNLAKGEFSVLAPPTKPPAFKAMKIRDMRFEEYVRFSTNPSRILDAQKLIKDLIISNHSELVDQLLAKCSQAYETDFGRLSQLTKGVQDLKDLPYDATSALGNMQYKATNGSLSMPKEGKIGGIASGIIIEFGFRDPDGNGHRQSITIFR